MFCRQIAAALNQQHRVGVCCILDHHVYHSTQLLSGPNVRCLVLVTMGDVTSAVTEGKGVARGCIGISWLLVCALDYTCKAANQFTYTIIHHASLEARSNHGQTCYMPLSMLL
jgi:hypothetical protein